MGAPEFEGPEVMLGGVAYTVAPLSFGALKATKERMRVIAEGTGSSFDVQEAFVDVIHASLQRNHPSLERDTVASGLDWDNAPAIFQQVMQRSQSPAAPGEKPAASPSGASTGT